MATSTWLIDWPTLDPGVVRSLQTWKAAAYKTFRMDDDEDIPTAMRENDLLAAMTENISTDLFKEKHKELLLRLESRSKMKTPEGWF